MNIQYKWLLRTWCAALVVWCTALPAEAGDAPVLADTYVSSITTPTDLTHTNYGTAVTLNVGSGGEALVQFDLSSIPGPVSKAALVVFANTVNTAGSMDVYSLGGPWAEAGVSLNGGTSPTTTTAVPAVKNFLGTIAVSASSAYYSLDITAQVNRWITQTDANFGILLLPSPGSGVSALFDSKENVATSHPAYIAVLDAGPGGLSGQIQINNGGAFAGITLPSSGLLKGAPGPSFAPATVGTDYAPASSGTSLLKGNGSGGFSSAVAGVDYAAAKTTTIINGSSCVLGSNCTVSATGSARILYNPSGGTAAKCQSGIAAMAFSFGTSGAPIALCETDGIQAYVDFNAGITQTVYDRFLLPSDWAGTLAVTVSAYSASTSAPAITLAYSCIASTATPAPAFGLSQGLALTPNAASGLTTVKTRVQPGSTCAAGNLIEWRLTITASAAADLKLLSVLFTE